MLLVADARGVGVTVPEGDHADHTIGGHRDPLPEKRDRQDAGEDEVTDPRTGGEDHDAAQQRDERRRREIRLEQDEKAHHQIHDAEPRQPPTEASDELALLSRDRRHPDDHRQLGNLGRLNPNTQHLEPAPRPVPGRRDRLRARHHQNHQRQNRQAQQRPGGSRVEPVVHARHHVQQQQPHQRLARLQPQVEVVGETLLLSQERAGAVNVHQSDEHQKDGHAQQHARIAPGAAGRGDIRIDRQCRRQVSHADSLTSFMKRSPRSS